MDYSDMTNLQLLTEVEKHDINLLTPKERYNYVKRIETVKRNREANNGKKARETFAKLEQSVHFLIKWFEYQSKY